MSYIINRMKRPLTLHPEGRNMLRLPPGVPVQVNDEVIKKYRKDTYFQYYVDHRKIEITQNIPPDGISFDPKITITSEKEKPEILTPTQDKEKTKLGTKTEHNVKTDGFLNINKNVNKEPEPKTKLGIKAEDKKTKTKK